MLTWTSMGYRQRAFDAVLIVLYSVAYGVSVFITPYDDLLTYNFNRIPGKIDAFHLS